jgi:dethiobiotin synthetase
LVPLVVALCHMGKIIYITGTDTGVGKTVLTGLLLCALLRNHKNVRALKPFSSGGREDAQLFFELQSRAVPLDEINPFHFNEPIAPALSAKKEGHSISLKDALEAVRKHLDLCDYLLGEGAGGLLSPLGVSVARSSRLQVPSPEALSDSQPKAFNLRDIIRELPGNIIVVARNRLGVINHTLLTLEALPRTLETRTAIVLLDHGDKDASKATNASALRKLLDGTPLSPTDVLELNLAPCPQTADEFKNSQQQYAEALLSLCNLLD